MCLIGSIMYQRTRETFSPTRRCAIVAAEVYIHIKKKNWSNLLQRRPDLKVTLPHVLIHVQGGNQRKLTTKQTVSYA